MPVSYTHLDVYKRQLHERAVAILDGLIFLRQAGHFGKADSCATPVSYTHLDVYKRQVPD